MKLLITTFSKKTFYLVNNSLIKLPYNDYKIGFKFI